MSCEFGRLSGRKLRVTVGGVCQGVFRFMFVVGREGCETIRVYTGSLYADPRLALAGGQSVPQRCSLVVSVVFFLLCVCFLLVFVFAFVCLVPRVVVTGFTSTAVTFTELGDTRALQVASYVDRTCATFLVTREGLDTGQCLLF